MCACVSQASLSRLVVLIFYFGSFVCTGITLLLKDLLATAFTKRMSRKWHEGKKDKVIELLLVFESAGSGTQQNTAYRYIA